MRRFLLPLARLETGWAENVLVEVDAEGIIASLQANAADQTGMLRLPGPVLPGMANLHSHAFQRAMAGMAETAGPEKDSFWTWREAMYRFALAVRPEDLEAISAQLYAELLCRGYTAVGEFHYLHHRPDGGRYDDRAELSWRILAGAEIAGIALTHLPVLYAHSGFGGRAALPRQSRFLHDLDGFAAMLDKLGPAFAKRPDRRLGMAPHSLRAVTPEMLKAMPDLLPEGAPIHIHIAEQTAEVEECIAWSGQRPVQWLLDAMPVNAAWCLVHATHMDADEIRRLAASAAVAGLCPTTEANLGDGLFSAPEYLAAGGAFGIGSDSHVSSDPAEELRLLEYGQRLTTRQRNVLAGGPGGSTGQRLFDAARKGGAQALGQKMGLLAPGYRADFVVLDHDAPSLFGKRGDALLDGWIFGGGDNPVREVYVRGRRMVSEGRHIRADEIARNYRAALKGMAALI